MLTAISRYGARVLPNTQQLIAACARRDELIQGPAIAEFEKEFARRHPGTKAVSTSYGRMAFYYLLKALNLPPGSEVTFPALTFWVIPEMARILGLKPVFVDIDPATYNLNPDLIEQAITPRTRVIVPTHLYGLPCDMDRIMQIARKHNLVVIEDCAHALGARYRGKPVGTFGDAAFFSFQTLKPLNTYGGGVALVRDTSLARRVADLAGAEPWPSEAEIKRKLLIGRAQRILIRPTVFRWTLFPILWGASFLRARPDVYLWEAIRPLEPLPQSYRRRFSNVQAEIGLAGLRLADEWTEATVRHANILTELLRSTNGVSPPATPADRTHVFYQYCLRVPDRDRLVRRCIRRGLDIETLHVDVCTRLPLFEPFWSSCPEAVRAAEAVQLPVYSSLSDDQIVWVGQTIRKVLSTMRARPGTFAESAPR